MEQKTIDLAAELQAENEDDLFNTLTAISDIAERLANKRTKKKTEANRMNKNYGLTGKTVKAKFNGGDSDAYPWQGMAVPVLITGGVLLVVVLFLLLSFSRCLSRIVSGVVSVVLNPC